MFARHTLRGFAQNATCLLLAAVIVAASLAFGAMGVEAMASNVPVVTITQIV